MNGIGFRDPTEAFDGRYIGSVGRMKKDMLASIHRELSQPRGVRCGESDCVDFGRFGYPLCANITETSCVTAISEQGGKENQHGNDERFCSPGVTSSLTA